MDRLKDKTVVMTGACGDIGRATCRKMCREGACVIMTDIMPAEQGNLVAAETGADGPGSVRYLRCDAGDRASIDAMLEQVIQWRPRIDVVIGNAATVENSPFLDIRPDQWQAHLDLNLTGNFHLGQAAARIMVGQEPLLRPGIERGVRGKILFTSSWCQDLPWPEGCCYGVSKAGLNFLTRAMAQELAASGIRVNNLAPGIVMAGLSKVCYETDPDFGPRATAAIPLREFQTPEQCADAFVFLAGDESDYITGISLVADGGASLPRRD